MIRSCPAVNLATRQAVEHSVLEVVMDNSISFDRSDAETPRTEICVCFTSRGEATKLLWTGMCVAIAIRVVRLFHALGNEDRRVLCSTFGDSWSSHEILRLPVELQILSPMIPRISSDVVNEENVI